MTTLTIKDLSLADQPDRKDPADIHLLSAWELKRIFGGRAVRVTVDGGATGTTGTVDDFSVNMDIFMGNIKGPFLL